MQRSGSYAGVFWVNIGMIVSLVLNDTDNLAPIILATCGIPFACACGAFAARMFKI